MKIIGHRGARGLAPENTLAGLQKAIEHGVDEVEFDVRVTRDQVPVLAHDTILHSPSGETLQIATHTLTELRAFKSDVTTLAEVFEQLDGTIALYIEVKAHEPVEPIATVIAAYMGDKWSTSNMSLASKHQKTLLKLHRTLPEIPTIVIESWSGVRANYRARRVDTKRVSMRATWLWSGFLRAMQRSGIEVIAYTVNDPKRVKQWQPYLYGVVTDYPDRFSR